MNESTLVDFDNLTREFVLESCDGKHVCLIHVQI